MFNTKFDSLTQEIATIKQDLVICKEELKASTEREFNLLKQISKLQAQNTNPDQGEMGNNAQSKQDFYIVGSSVLREATDGDFTNASVKSISGTRLKDIREDIKALEFEPKTIIPCIGGNDLDNVDQSLEDIKSEYALLLAEIQEKFPETKMIIAGLVPRFKNDIIRSKVKKWSVENQIKFIDNESSFELRSGDVDTSVFVMSGRTPCVHLTRDGTVRLQENIQKHVLDLCLSDLNRPNQTKARSYADILKSKSQSPLQQSWKPRYGARNEHTEHTSWTPRRGCFNCSERNHVQSQCKFSQKIQCHKCHKMGHKKTFCDQ